LAKSDLHIKLFTHIQKELEELGIPEHPVSLYQPYLYAMEMGGKRIRPLLTLLANGICEGKTEDALPAAMAVEVLHNFTLVHDDIMDSAETRRGKESVYKKWDQNKAILSGDVMFADSFRLLHHYADNDEFSKKEYSAIIESFTTASITVCEGQARDMDFVSEEFVSHEQYLEMIKGKTSALLAASLSLGAISAHATENQIQNLFNLGIEMGIAFQIQDDLLDASADPEKFGKRLGGDIYEGKKTYLTILALERADEAQKEFISNVLSNENNTESEVTEVLKIMSGLNVLNDIAKEVDQHYEEAFNLLNQFKDTEYKQELKNLLIFLQNRDH